jgi:two-component system sensor histidine kinase MtrB
VRARLTVAFVVVALVAALTALTLTYLLSPARYAAYLTPMVIPGPLRHALYQDPGGMKHITGGHVAALWLTAGVVLLVAIAAMAVTACRRVLLPVRRLAQAAQRMSGGELSVRIQPRGRDELAQLVTTFNAMASALENKVGELQRMEAKARQFGGDVAHELRTPLTAMTAVADLLQDDPPASGDAATAACLVGQEIRHLNRLVNDLIEIFRFDAGTAELMACHTDVAAAVDGCLRARNWADVIFDVPAGLAVPVDRRRFDVIVANLVGNALRHGSPPVTVRASIEPDGQGGKELALEVRDHGPGLPPTATGQVFDRFYKADSSRARSEGSGLGLAIAWENARLHGGRIDAGNRPDGGAVFTCRLPVH